MDPRERLEKLRRLKQLRQKAGTTAPAQQPIQVQQQHVQQSPIAQELRTQPERARYSQEMTAQAFGDRPTSGEYLQAGLFGTPPMRPSQLAGNIDLTKGEPGLAPAFMPEILTGLGGAAAAVAGRNVTRGIAARQAAAKRDWMDGILEPYMGRAAQIQRELRGADKTVFGTYKFKLDKQMRQQKEVAKTIPGFTSGKNMRDNLASVNAEIGNASKQLKSRLLKSNKPVSRQEVEFFIRKEFESYKKTLRGVGFKVDDDLVDDSVEAVLRAFDDVPSNPSGLWEARKLVDREFKGLNGPRRYAAAVSGDPSTMIPTKKEVIWELSRDGMLKLMEKKVPGSTKRMRRVSIMYDIQHTLATKAPDVKPTLTGRVKEKIPFMGDKPIKLAPRNWINR